MITLVTGGNGLVGYALKKERPDFIYISKNECDLRDFSATCDIVNEIRPERIIHLAALVGGIGGNIMKSADFFRDNIQINMNILEAARLNKVSKLISFMSTCVFPNEGPYPLSPENLHFGPPHPSNFGYAYAKRMLEVQTRAYREQWGLNYQIGIPANIYGENDNFNLIEGHVVPALIHKCFIARETNSSLKIWGSGAPLREFVYSKDVARLISWMIEKYDEKDALILSHGVETRITDLVQSIVKHMKFYGKVEFDSSKPDGQLRKPSNTSLLTKLLPEFKFTNLDEGIAETTAWFEQNYNILRK